MWCTRWFLPLLLLPLPTAPAFFLLLFLFSLTLHAKPCFYCIVLLTTLFVTSCYWQPFPLDSPLSVPWSENITTFAEALNASLPSNFSHPLPTVIRAVDRCWCDISAGSFFEPFNVSHWETVSVMRLKNNLERSSRVLIEANATAAQNTTDGITNTTQNVAQSTITVSNTSAITRHTWSLFTTWLLERKRKVEERADLEKETKVVNITNETGPEPWLRKEYDLRPYGFELVLDFSW